MSNDAAIREAAGHITGAAATVEVVANEFRAALREGRFDAFRPDRQFWRYELAKAAMQGLVGSDEARREAAKTGRYEKTIARWSINQADALLSELEREEGKGEGDG